MGILAFEIKLRRRWLHPTFRPDCTGHPQGSYASRRAQMSAVVSRRALKVSRTIRWRRRMQQSISSWALAPETHD